MKLRIASASLIAAALMLSSRAGAEDIDLFSSGNTSAAAAPNVLFIIDNTANWNLAFTGEMAALASTFDNLPANAFNIGISFYTETGNPNNNTDGGYVRAAIRNMTAANKLKYKTLIQNFDQNNDKSNGGKASLQIMESYYYFAGKAPYAGNSKAKTDYAGNTCSNCNLTAAQKAANAAVYALPGNALTAFAGSPYTSPVDSDGCAKNFIIYISNGPPQENNSDKTLATTRLAAEGGNTTTIPLTPNGSQDSVADEWARFLKTSSIGAKTYTIDVKPNNTGGQYPGWQAVLKSMANVSGGKYFYIDPALGAEAQIADALSKILSEIQAVNTVFASVSLPVSVNTQGSYLNQVYVGLFRPDGNSKPRWNGNLKQYKLKLTGTDLKLVDANETPAINTSTGFITECARSFWTPSTTDTYWTFNPNGGCIPPAGLGADVYKNSNFPDGNVVEKGGHGYLLRGAANTTVANPRTIKTCDPNFSSCTTLTNFVSSNSSISKAAMGVPTATDAERTNYIEWARGSDIQEENGNANTAQVRPSAHGDVIHSRPVALNFGSDASPKIGVFYGDNGGVFRSINGNRTSAIGGVAAGAPMFEFFPPEFYGQIKRIYDNDVLVNIPGVIGGADTPLPKPYGMEGPVTAYDAGTERWIYATMRRGGRAFYAFAVNASDPLVTTLKWKKGCPNQADDNGCSTDFLGIGQTWAPPVAFKAEGYSSGNLPLLIAGGGYDTCEDNDGNPTAACGSPKGAKVFIMDANTGAMVKTLSTTRSVIADTIIVPNSSGLAQYGYTADLGGNIYRITFGNGAVASWSITKIASLGCGTPSTCSNNRKFMFAPDVVEGDNGEYILLIGSGDREKPIEFYSGATGVSNYFFMIRDKPGDSNWLSSESGNCGANVICLSSLVNIPLDAATSPSAATLATKKGWYMSLHPKEQVVTSAITIFGTVNFSTQEPEPPPAAGSCNSGLGTTRLYKVGTDNGSSQNGTVTRYQTMPDVGLPPSPVAGLVTLDTGQTVAFCIGCNASSPLEAEQPPLPAFVTPNNPKARSYWYIEQ